MEETSSAQQPLDLLTQLVPGGSATLLLGLIFIAVMLGVLGAASLFGRDPVQRRLSGNAPRQSTKRKGKEDVPVLRSTQQRESNWDELLRPLEKYFVDQKDGAQSSLRMRMLQAGFVGPNVVRNYFLIRTVLAIGVPTAFLFLLPMIAGDMTAKKIMITTVGLGLAGLYLPGIWISSRVDRRQRALAEAFPDALDMMVVCVEAGLGLDAAFTRVGTQIAPAHPILATELGFVALELRAGKTREDALRNFAKRIGLREVSSFVTLLLQSDALGASIGQTLRVHAGEMRAIRMLRAEEMAHKLPVKLTFPLVTCILPTMFVAVMLPGIITLVRVLIPALG
jgi:tight adherence protein C